MTTSTQADVLEYTGHIDAQESSVFSDVYFLADGRTVFVFRTGSIFAYNLPERINQRLLSEDSLGSIYTSEIRGYYVGDRIDRYAVIQPAPQPEPTFSESTPDYGFYVDEETYSDEPAKAGPAQENVQRTPEAHIEVTLRVTVALDELSDTVAALNAANPNAEIKVNIA